MLKKQYSKSKPVCKVTFILPAEATEGGTEVRVVGDFNNWDWNQGVAMQWKKSELQAVVELPTGRNYEFRYLVDNQRWVNDWQADAYLPSPYFGSDNSVLMLDDQLVRVPAPAEDEPLASAAPKAGKASKAVKAAKEKDDLKKIEGVGPKIEGLLNVRGIVSFQDLATADISLLMEILEAAGSRYKMHDPTTWPQQAKLAAAGDWGVLNKLQAELKGGKR